MKIYIVGGTKDFIVRIQKALQKSGQEDVTIIHSTKITPEDLAEKAADCEILVASPSGFDQISKKHMEVLPKIRSLQLPVSERIGLMYKQRRNEGLSLAIKKE